MAFSFEKFLSDMMGNTDNTKKTNNKNAKTRVTKKTVSDEQKKALRVKQNIEAADYSSMPSMKNKKKVAADKIAETSARKKRIALRAKKEQSDIDKAYSRSAALSTIKKDANIKTDKGPKKKRIVTKEQLAKSGLSLRDYMNMLDGKTRIDKKLVDKPKLRPSSKTMVDSFKKSNVSANKNKKAGTDAAKGDNKKPKNYKKNTNTKLDSKGNYKGSNIKPTKLQLERMKKRRAKGATT